jgi:hypothetical protein
VIDELDLSAGELRRRRQQVEVTKLHLTQDGVADRSAADEYIVYRGGNRVSIDAEAACRISLWIAINEEGALLSGRKARC